MEIYQNTAIVITSALAVINTLKLQPYLFSQCFSRFFWLKFVKMLVFKLKYPQHELGTPN